MSNNIIFLLAASQMQLQVLVMAMREVLLQEVDTRGVHWNGTKGGLYAAARAMKRLQGPS